MKQIDKTSLKELEEMSAKMFGGIVKAVVDVARKVVVVDAEMHADIEEYLLENQSQQADLWGINFHPKKYGTDEFVEFDSMINIRPRQNNMSRSVEDPAMQQKIRAIVREVVHE